MFSKFRKSICLEDDILIKKDFLPFMKFYLNKYEKNDKVMNITGFGTDINLPKTINMTVFYQEDLCHGVKALGKTLGKNIR